MPPRGADQTVGHERITMLCLLEPENLRAKGNVPGPGTYAQVAETNSVGKYPLSTTP